MGITTNAQLHDLARQLKEAWAQLDAVLLDCVGDMPPLQIATAFDVSPERAKELRAMALDAMARKDVDVDENQLAWVMANVKP